MVVTAHMITHATALHTTRHTHTPAIAHMITRAITVLTALTVLHTIAVTVDIALMITHHTVLIQATPHTRPIAHMTLLLPTLNLQWCKDKDLWMSLEKIAIMLDQHLNAKTKP